MNDPFQPPDTPEPPEPSEGLPGATIYRNELRYTVGTHDEAMELSSTIRHRFDLHDELVKLLQEAVYGDPGAHVLGTDWHQRAAKAIGE